MNSWTLSLTTDPAYADDATILMCDQFQADSVLQSMPLLSHAQYFITVTATPASRVKAAVIKAAW